MYVEWKTHVHALNIMHVVLLICAHCAQITLALLSLGKHSGAREEVMQPPLPQQGLPTSRSLDLLTPRAEAALQFPTGIFTTYS